MKRVFFLSAFVLLQSCAIHPKTVESDPSKTPGNVRVGDVVTLRAFEPLLWGHQQARDSLCLKVSAVHVNQGKIWLRFDDWTILADTASWDNAKAIHGCESAALDSTGKLVPLFRRDTVFQRYAMETVHNQRSLVLAGSEQGYRFVVR